MRKLKSLTHCDDPHRQNLKIFYILVCPATMGSFVRTTATVPFSTNKLENVDNPSEKYFRQQPERSDILSKNSIFLKNSTIFFFKIAQWRLPAARLQSESGVCPRQGCRNAGLLVAPEYIGSSACLDGVCGGQGRRGGACKEHDLFVQCFSRPCCPGQGLIQQ